MTRFLTTEEVLRIHDLVAPGRVLHSDWLEAAVAQPSLELVSGYVYETLFLQAAVLLQRLAAGHAFVDGNKRTAWVACVAFLELNGIVMVDGPSQSDVADFVVSVVADHLDQVVIARWLERISALE